MVVAVGHRLGLPGEAPLKHAVRDATRLRDVFVQIGGARRDHAILLEEPSAAGLMSALARASAIARTRRPDEVTLIFYFSGHGDRERLHLGRESIALADLDAKLAAIPATLRVVIVDACRTADVRRKGVATEDAFAITLDGAASASGIVRIHASADGEVAQESDALGGAIFTHYLLTGLAGAADGDADARVTLAEAYAFAYSQTLYRSARASGVLQRPSVELDLKGAAPVVLTHTATATSLVVPRAADAHYLVYALGSRVVVGEVWSSPDRPISIAVAPGKYIIHKRAGGRSAAAQLDVGRGEHRELRAADFKAVPEEALARKGGDLLLRPHELGLSYEVLTSRLVDVGHQLGVAYAYSWEGGWALSAGAFGGLGALEGTAQAAELAWLGLEGALEQRVRLGFGVLRLSAGPRAIGVVQSLRRDDSARLASVGYVTDRTFRGAAFGAHALGGLRVPLSTALWFELDARGALLGGRVEDGLSVLWSAGLGAIVGATF